VDEEAVDGDYRWEVNNYGYSVQVCNWVGEPRTPETIKITGMRPAWSAARGSQYEIYDRFGHCMSNCGVVDMAEINRTLARGLTDINAGPYKAVVWNGAVRKGRLYDGSTNPPTVVPVTKGRTKANLVRDLEALCLDWENHAKWEPFSDYSSGKNECARLIRDVIAKG
jgi:hypothetical protein